MGNLGTIIRTMAGFGFANLVLIRPAADVFDPKTVRASVGTVFRLSFEYFDTFNDYRGRPNAQPLSVHDPWADAYRRGLLRIALCLGFWK